MAATTTTADSTPDNSEGMAYLDTLPRRVVTVYLPLFVILVVLLFPFYWMALTAIKPDEQLIDMDTYNPFWVVSPTLKHISKLLFQTNYPLWLWNTMMISVAATVLSLFASVLARPTRSCGSATRARWGSARRSSSPILVPPSILFIPLATIIQATGSTTRPFALVLVYPTILIPFSTWLLMGYFKDHPLRAGGMRADRRGEPLADPGQDHPAAGGAGADLGRHLLADLCWNEFIYALTFLSSTQNKTVPVAVVSEFVDGDI